MTTNILVKLNGLTNQVKAGKTNIITGRALYGGGTSLYTEPTFNAGTQTMIWQDDFHTYTSWNDMVAAGYYQGASGATGSVSGVIISSSVQLDTSTNAAGAQQLIAPGYSGDAKAFRLQYDGVANSAGQEAHSLDLPISDVLCGKPGHTLYISYYYRLTGGGGNNIDYPTPKIRVQVKWLELWTRTEGSRAQFNLIPSPTNNSTPPFPGQTDGTGTLWGFDGTANPPFGTNPNGCAQQAGPWVYQTQGQWNRVTYKYCTTTSSGSMDGCGMMWHGGTLIVGCHPSLMNVAVPNAVGVNGFTGQPNPWCTSGDLANQFWNDSTEHLAFGSVVAGEGPVPFTIDIARLTVWRD